MKSKYRKIPSHKFQGINSGLVMHYPQPWRWKDDFSGVKIEKGWKIIGWCEVDKLLGYLRKDRDDCIAIMFESPNGEDVWFHATETFLK